MAISLAERPQRRVRILLTGFGRFPGVPANPTASIVAEIARTGGRRLARCGFDLSTAVLAVEFERIGPQLARELALVEADAALHLGLAGARSALTVEARARNRLSPLHPDAAGRRPAHRSVAPQGPDLRRTRLPVARLVVALRQSGAPTWLSNDAGAYICNAALYLSLASPVSLAGFIHLPWPRRADRPLRRGRLHPPTRAAMLRAVTAALLVVGAETRRRRRALTRGQRRS